VKRVCIIGAGIGGLALAIRLQSAGIATTVVEARDRPGGRAYVWERDGFTFDAGPTVITDPNCLAELWRLSGQDIAADVELLPVMPFYRLNWPDGTTFDYSNDEASLRRELARLSPGDLAGYDEFLEYATAVYEEGYVRLGAVPFLNFSTMVKAAPALMRQQAWRSVYAMVSHYISNEKLREAFSFHTLLVGGNPMTTSAIYALIHKLEKDGGVWWAKGGTNRLVAGMVALFERLGGTLRLGDPVSRIEVLGDRVTEVETTSGWRDHFDAVASNADLVHTYRELLGDTSRGRAQARRLTAKRWSPSLFVVHFGLAGSFPNIPHHTILFGPRYEGLLKDIYDYGVLPQDFSIYLHHPSVTDPAMAPRGNRRSMR
jgi:phytoene desaturase